MTVGDETRSDRSVLRSPETTSAGVTESTYYSVLTRLSVDRPDVYGSVVATVGVFKLPLRAVVSHDVCESPVARESRNDRSPPARSIGSSLVLPPPTVRKIISYLVLKTKYRNNVILAHDDAAAKHLGGSPFPRPWVRPVCSYPPPV